MNQFNSNDMLILRSVMDKEDKRGISKAKGSTVGQICEKSGLGISKVRNTLKVLIDVGYVDYAVKLVNKNAYYITEKGIKELKELSRNILEG